MASEDFRHPSMGHLPPIVPRYNSYLLNSLDDIFLEEIREDATWQLSDLTQFSAEEEIKEEINISSDSLQDSSNCESLLSSSIKNDSWNCPICLDIFEEPVETPCCHNLFCERCIEPVLKCPICKKLLVRCLPNIPIKRLVQELSVKCRHPLCEKTVKKAMLSKHESLCEMALMKCIYSSACGNIVKKELKVHLTERCQFRPTKCDLECGRVLPYIELNDHKENSCPNAQVTCPQDCGSVFIRKESAWHLNQHCPNGQVSCPFVDYFGTVCGTPCLRKDLKEHQLTCNFREVRCSNPGCKDRIMYQYLQDHEDICKYQIIKCINLCEASFLRKELDEHKETCPLEIIECSYKAVGCSVKVVRRDFEEHLKANIKGHEMMMLRTLGKHGKDICRLEAELNEFKNRAFEELWQIRAIVEKRALSESFEDEIPNPFAEIIKQQ